MAEDPRALLGVTVKSLIAFLQVVLQDMEDWCHISTAADLKTISGRVEHEGTSFLTISLADFGKDLQKGLDRGHVAHDLFQGFAWSGGLPRFFSGFLELVFARSTGLLLDDPSVDAIRAVHQITSMFSKIGLECSDERKALAIEKYVQCEQEVRVADASLDLGLARDYKKASITLFSELYSAVDLKVYNGEIVPKHGPGATADRLTGNRKWDQTEWTWRLEQYFPAGEFVLPNWRYHHLLADIDFLEPSRERPVRVVLVPKTLKTPRVIAVEPTATQWCQQALMQCLVEGIEGDDFLSPFIGFTDQVPNRDLAREGSINGHLATLDLSEASDRVSNQHVRALLSDHPHLHGAVQACRTRKADVDGKIYRLAKFASMGSALCFPFEAMVFLTIIFTAIGRELNRPVTRSLVREFRGQVRVYGDDIIVPVNMMSCVSRTLEAFGLKVNQSKSFGTGRFRESCGGDYYAGVWITPVRMRSLFPRSRKDVPEVVSTVSLRNQLWKTEMYPKSVAWLDHRLGRVLPFYPEVEPSSSVLGRHTSHPLAEKMCSKLQIPLVKGYVVRSRLPNSKLEGVGALAKFLYSRARAEVALGYSQEGPLYSSDPEHLVRAGRPVSVDIKTRKASIR